MEAPHLLGKVIIRGKIEAKTGLHIGGSQVKLEIGGVDLPIVRDPLTNRPYIPGSSLKGKMRSLLEKAKGKKPNKNIGTPEHPIRIHLCDNPEELQGCEVCKIFGMPSSPPEKGQKAFNEPTRLIVRDAPLTDESAGELEGLELPYSEVKWENAIDRMTSAANPRQVERVPAGAEFEFELIYNVFEEEDVERLKHVFEALSLVEHDYLGGHGSRGYGQVVFKDIRMWWNSKADYESGNIDVAKKAAVNDGYDTPAKILEKFDEIKGKIELGRA